MNVSRSMFWAAGSLLVSVLLIQISFVNAQEAAAEAPVVHLESRLRFSHLDSDDGLVQNTVEAILEDHKGFMWFGTEAGLSRYDGYRFTNFQHDPNNPNSLSHNHVRDLYEDRDGMIWIATEGGGINRLDPTTSTFTHYGAPPGTPNAIVGDRHFTILQDSRGHLWAGGGLAFGLTDYDPTTQSAITYFSVHSAANEFQFRGIGDIVEAADQQLWIAANPAIIRHDLIDRSFTRYDLREFEETRVKALRVDRMGNLWAGGSQGLFRYDEASDRFEHFPDLPSIEDILDAENGHLWLATSQGLYRFNPQTQEILGSERPYAGVTDSLSSETLRRLYQSRAGLIWIGGDNGLNVYDPRLEQFAFYPHSVPDRPASLSAGEIQAIYIADDNIAWIGVGSVLHKVNLNSGDITLYRLEDYDLGTQSITAILQDHAGMLWLGGSQSRLLYFDPDTESFNEFPSLIEDPARNQRPGGAPADDHVVVALHEDAENRLWVVYKQGGLFRIDETRETVIRYNGPDAGTPLDGAVPSGAIIRPPVGGMFADRAGNLWLTNLNGFYRFDPVDESYTRFRLMTSKGSDTWTEASFEDANGIIWVASRDGLFRLDPRSEEVRHFTTDDGLPTNFLVGILEAANGDLWLSSKKGLSRFTPSTETFRNYDRFDGLQGSDFSSRVFAQARDGRMFFGGNNGLTAFYPQEISDSDYQPPVVLDDFQLFYESVQPGADSPLSQPIWLTNSLTLDHTQNILSFEFAVLNYAFDDENLYRYQLEGLDDKWHETDSTRRFASYTNLPAGDYTFRVQAANRDGVWSNNEVALALTMLPPWWETSGFRLVAILTAVSLVLGGYRWRVRAIARHNQELQREVDQQTQALIGRTNELQASELQLREAKEAADAANRSKSAFLANMSHELRSPLNSILGFAQISNRMPNLPTELRENLSIILHSGEHLLELINQVLDLSKIEAGQMVLQNNDVDLYRMLDNLEEMFTLAARTKQLSLTFECAENLPRYISTDGTKLRQVLINLIGNAVKFTDSGDITVRVTSVPVPGVGESPQARLSFQVTDTGSGIPAEELPQIFEAFTQTAVAQKTHEGTGLGLPISRKIVRLLGGDISVSSVLGQGTSFSFEMSCPVVAAVRIQPAHDGQLVFGLAEGQPAYRILIVDDKWANRQLLVKLLEPLGFELREADNGQDAITIARSFKPHLIWMDIRMPVMDGMEATRRLKALPEGRAMVIVALTASGYDEERAQILASGCDDVLSKPFRAADIIELMGRKLGVQYVYNEDTPAESTPRTLLTPAETDTLLRSLPYELLQRLIESVELGDLQMIAAIAEDVSEYNAALAGTVSQLVQRFEFDELLAMLKVATE